MGIQAGNSLHQGNRIRKHAIAIMSSKEEMANRRKTPEAIAMFQDTHDEVDKLTRYRVSLLRHTRRSGWGEYRDAHPNKKHRKLRKSVEVVITGRALVTMMLTKLKKARASHDWMYIVHHTIGDS
jgi:hypothetical protein